MKNEEAFNADKIEISEKERYKVLKNYLKLYGCCNVQYAQKILQTQLSKFDFLVKENIVLGSPSLCDNIDVLLGYRLNSPMHVYSTREVYQGRGYRQEETKARAAVREWMTDHHIEKIDAAIRQLRVLQEILLHDALMSEARKVINVLLSQDNNDAQVSCQDIIIKAARVTDLQRTAAIVNADASSLLPLLQAWNGCIRTPLLNGSTINETLDYLDERIQINRNFYSPDDPKIALINQYIVAMAHLYSVIPLKKAYEIINSQNPGLISWDEFQDYCWFGFQDPSGETIVESGEIQRESFVTPQEEYEDLKHQQAGKPWYIPPKEQFLQYADYDYIEDNLERRALESFLQKKLHVDRNKVEDCIIMISVDPTNMEWILDQMEEMGIRCSTLARMNEFLNLLMNFTNNLRIPANRGYTPNELIKLKGKNRGPLQVQFGPGMMDMIEKGEMNGPELIREFENKGVMVAPETKAKVGRNELCPCGSGKKYKKCCGRLN